MASIRFRFRPSEDVSSFIKEADNEDLEILRQEIQNVSEGKQLTYCISYINQICRNLCLETSLYPHLQSILKDGIESCIMNECFYSNMSVGYTQLMNQIGIIQLLFQHFEKYVMKDEDLKSIRLLQISILKDKLSGEDIEKMIQTLLDDTISYMHTNFHFDETLLQEIESNSIIDTHSMREGGKVNVESAHNLTLLLIDIDEYK